MSNELVPYQQMERMAVVIAKANLFGMKTPEQALSLMLLCQAEGMNPVVAVRDYHIIQGRPTLKAETMLARFLQAGGKVEWHAYTDVKCEATFSHPAGGTIRIDWNMDRAKKAGLAGKDNWVAYPRAMLRSRLISEAIRTVAPHLVLGVYTDDEVINSSAELPPSQDQRIDAIANTMLSEQKAEHIKAIKESADTAALRDAFKNAWNAAGAMKDEMTKEEFRQAYEERKAELERPVIEGEVSEETGTQEQI